MIDENFDYAGLISKLEDHMKNPRYFGLLDTYTCKATAIHPDGKAKVHVTMKIEEDKLLDAGFSCEGFDAAALIGQSSLYMDSAFNATLSETFILAGNLLKQIKDDESKESRNSMLFLTAYKECVEAYYEKETQARVAKLSF